MLILRYVVEGKFTKTFTASIKVRHEDAALKKVRSLNAENKREGRANLLRFFTVR